MNFQEAFKESGFIRRGYWQGKFMRHDSEGELWVSNYPGSSYPPNKEDLDAEDWEPFEFDDGVIV